MAAVEMATSTSSQTFMVEVPAGVSAGEMFTIQLQDGQQLQVQVPAGVQAGQQIQIQAPPAAAVMVPACLVPLAMDRDAAAAPHLSASLAAVGQLGESVTFRKKLRQAVVEDRGFAGFGAAAGGVLPVLDGTGQPSLSVRYASNNPRLRELDAVLTTKDGTVVAEFRRAAAAGGMSSLVAVNAAQCQVMVGGLLYATITGGMSAMPRLTRVSDQRSGAGVVGQPGAICCGPYNLRISTDPGVPERVVTIDSDPCLPMCPSCLICSFNLGQRRVCELGNTDPQSQLDLLLLYTFMAVDPLTVVSSGG